MQVNSVMEKPRINIYLYDSAARDIQIVKPLEDVEVNEYESASFVCEISHDEVQTQWYKNDNKLKASDNIRMRQDGRRKTGDPALEGGWVGWVLVLETRQEGLTFEVTLRFSREFPFRFGDRPGH